MIRSLCVLFCMLCSLYVQGQSVTSIEKKLLHYSNEIDRYERLQHDPNYYDSLVPTNKLLLNYLARTCVRNSAMLTAAFKGLDKTRIHFVSSDDKKMRAYWWHDGNPGTMRCYNAVLVYAKTKEKVGIEILNDLSKAEDYDFDPGGAYTDVYTIKTLDGQTVYLLQSIGYGAPNLVGYGIKAYSIKNGTLISAPFFKTKTQTLTEIELGVDYFAPADADVSERVDIKMSKDHRTLYIPFIKDNGRITNRNLVYRFDGYHFVYDKIYR